MTQTTTRLLYDIPTCWNIFSRAFVIIVFYLRRTLFHLLSYSYFHWLSQLTLPVLTRTTVTPSYHTFCPIYQEAYPRYSMSGVYCGSCCAWRPRSPPSWRGSPSLYNIWPLTLPFRRNTVLSKANVMTSVRCIVDHRVRGFEYNST